MCAISITGGPRVPRPTGFLLLALLAVIPLFLHGCGNHSYQPVPECEVSKPPKGERYIQAGPDERLALMTSAYIEQVRIVTDCNADIRLINVSNKAARK